MRRDVFQAIADPTRREIINLIAGKPLPLNSIAENFEVSRPAISKHIKILTECGIVTIHSRGRERYCEAQLQKLSEVTLWIDHFRVYWNQKLDALGEFLEKEMAAAPAKAAIPAKVVAAPAKTSATAPTKTPPTPAKRTPKNIQNKKPSHPLKKNKK
jgi:DNA-binding transcriptional ArsR family regulator